MAFGRPALSSVEQVREELRQLGYLDTSLDRFVLAGAGPGSALRASARVALRVGLAGGVLFGATLALAAAGQDRRLLAAPQDLAVLTLYLSILLGAVVAAAAGLGGLLAAASTRRGRKPRLSLSRNVGLGLALFGLVYVALWWRSHAPTTSGLGQAAAILIGLGLSLALARFGTLAAVAVLSTGRGPERLPEASLSRRRMVPLLVLTGAALGGGVAVASYLSGRSGGGGAAFAVVPTGLRVRLVAVDGLDGAMAEHMMGRGELPRLAHLLAQGAHGPLRAEPQPVPALVWTTVATGRGPEAHGIQSTGARRLLGMRVPVALDDQGRFARAVTRAADLLRLTRAQAPTSVLRGVKTLWNVASEKGLRVGVVNWWATWPVEPVHGYVVSDRAFLRLKKGGTADREVHPPEALAPLLELAASVPGEGGPAIDRFALLASRALREREVPDLEALYLPGLDIVSMQELGETAADLARLDAQLGAVRDYYRFIDGVLGELEAARRPDEVLVLVGDPGRLSRRSGSTATGILALVGGPVLAQDLGPVSERDVAPTVLHLLGLPVSRELEGQVLLGALAPPFRQDHPVRSVASYGTRPPAHPEESALDRDVLEQLRSLGYVQ